MLTLTVPETQLVEWVQQLSPTSKRKVLWALIPTLEDYEALVAYGSEQARDLAAERGLDWETLTDPQREDLVDIVLHES